MPTISCSRPRARLPRAFPRLVTGAFQLDKELPVAAGLGGGSADAAAALRLLARANDLPADDPRLYEAARATGADVPVCLDPRPRLMWGIGEKLSAPLNLPKLPAVLVNPGVALATKDVFAGWTRAVELPAAVRSCGVGKNSGPAAIFAGSGAAGERSRSCGGQACARGRRSARRAAHACRMPVRPHVRIGRDMFRSFRRSRRSAERRGRNEQQIPTMVGARLRAGQRKLAFRRRELRSETRTAGMASESQDHNCGPAL